MSTRTAVIALLVLGLAWSAGAQGPPVDPQSLVGEWAGTVLGPLNLDYFLTITKAEGNRVSGRARVSSPTVSGQYPIEGTVEGNVLKYRSLTTDLVVELVIEGDTMKGVGERKRSGAVGKFELTRQK